MMNHDGLTLSDLKVGEQVRIVCLDAGNRAYRYKLLALGLTPGTEFTVVRRAPLGDPLEIQIRDYSLSLRSDEAALIKVERVICCKSL